MKKDLLWDLFVNTGKIEYYIKYKEELRGSKNGRIITIGKLINILKEKHIKVLMIARDSETLEDIVIYEGLYGDHIIWARPYDMFNSLVDKEKYPDIKQEYRLNK